MKLGMKLGSSLRFLRARRSGRISTPTPLALGIPSRSASSSAEFGSCSCSCSCRWVSSPSRSASTSNATNTVAAAVDWVTRFGWIRIGSGSDDYSSPDPDPLTGCPSRIPTATAAVAHSHSHSHSHSPLGSRPSHFHSAPAARPPASDAVSTRRSRLQPFAFPFPFPVPFPSPFPARLGDPAALISLCFPFQLAVSSPSPPPSPSPSPSPSVTRLGFRFPSRIPSELQRGGITSLRHGGHGAGGLNPNRNRGRNRNFSTVTDAGNRNVNESGMTTDTADTEQTHHAASSSPSEFASTPSPSRSTFNLKSNPKGKGKSNPDSNSNFELRSHHALQSAARSASDSSSPPASRSGSTFNNSLQSLSTPQQWMQFIQQEAERTTATATAVGRLLKSSTKTPENSERSEESDVTPNQPTPTLKWGVVLCSAAMSQLYKINPRITPQQATELVQSSAFHTLASHIIHLIQQQHHRLLAFPASSASPSTSIPSSLSSSPSSSSSALQNLPSSTGKPFDGRAIANVIYSCAKIPLPIRCSSPSPSPSPSSPSAPPIALQLIHRSIDRFLHHQSIQAASEPRHLSNLVWALDKLRGMESGLGLDESDDERIKRVMEVAAKQMQHKLRECQPQSISNLLVGFAGRGFVDLEWIDRVAAHLLSQTPQQWQQWKEQELANTIHSMVKLGIGTDSQSELYREMYQRLTDECVQRIASGRFKPQEVSNISLSIAKIDVFLLDIDSATASAVGQSVRATSTWNVKLESSGIHRWFTSLLAHLTQSSSVSSSSSSSSSSPAAKSLVDQFKPQERSNLIWSLAQLYDQWQPNQQLFYSLLHQLLHQMAESTLRSPDPFRNFKPQELANLALSYADLRSYHPALMKQMAKYLCHQHITQQLNEQDCSNLLLAFAKLGIRSVSLSTAIATRLLHLLDAAELTIQSMINSCWSFAVFDHLRLPLPSQFVIRVIQQLNDGNSGLQLELSISGLNQLHQLQLSLQQLQLSVSPSSSSSSSSLPLLSLPLAARCRDAMVNRSDRGESNSQNEVSRVLKSMGVTFESEYVIPECGYSVDFYLTDPKFIRDGKGLIVQFHGPLHYLVDLSSPLFASSASSSSSSPSFTAFSSFSSSSSAIVSCTSAPVPVPVTSSVLDDSRRYRLHGADRFRDEQLAAAGYRVVSIAYFQWDNRSREEKTEWLHHHFTR